MDFLVFLFLFSVESLAYSDKLISAELTNENTLQSNRGLRSISTTPPSVNDAEPTLLPTTQDVIIQHARIECENCLRAHRECKTLLECNICHIPCEVFVEDAIPTTKATLTTNINVGATECSLCLQNNPKCKGNLRCEPCKTICKITDKDLQASLRAASRCRICRDTPRCKRHAKCDHCKKYCDQDDESVETITTESVKSTITEEQAHHIQSLSGRRKAGIARLAQTNEMTETTTTESVEPLQTTTKGPPHRIQSLSGRRKAGISRQAQTNEMTETTTTESAEPLQTTTKGPPHRIQSLSGRRKAGIARLAQTNEMTETTTTESVEPLQTTTKGQPHRIQSLSGRSKAEMVRLAQRNEMLIETTTTDDVKLLPTTTEEQPHHIQSLTGRRKAGFSRLAQRNEITDTTTVESEKPLQITTEGQAHHIQSLTGRRKSGIVRLTQRNRPQIVHEVERDIHDNGKDVSAPVQENCDPILVFPAVSDAKDMKEATLSETAPRYYTIGALRPGPRMNHFLRLLNVHKVEDVEKLIVIAKLKSNQPLSSGNEVPIIIDYSKLIQNDDKQAEPGNGIDGPSIDLSSEIDRALQMAAEQKKVTKGISSLTPDEAFKVIQHAISLHDVKGRDQASVVAQTAPIPDAVIDESTTSSNMDLDIIGQKPSIPVRDLIREKLVKSLEASQLRSNSFEEMRNAEPINIKSESEMADNKSRDAEHGFIEEILPSINSEDHDASKEKDVVSSELVAETSTITPLEIKMMQELEAEAEAERSLISPCTEDENEEPIINTTMAEEFSTEIDSSNRQEKLESTRPLIGSRNKNTKASLSTEANADGRNSEINEKLEAIEPESEIIEDLKKTVDEHKAALHEATIVGKQKIESALDRMKDILKKEFESNEQNVVGMHQEETTLNTKDIDDPQITETSGLEQRVTTLKTKDVEESQSVESIENEPELETVDNRKKDIHDAVIVGKQEIESDLNNLKDMLLESKRDDIENNGINQEIITEQTTVMLEKQEEQSLIKKFTDIVADDLTGSENLTETKKEEVKEEISKLVKSTVDGASQQRTSENADSINRDLDEIESIVETEARTEQKKVIPSEGNDAKINHRKNVVSNPNNNQELVGDPFIIEGEDFTAVGSTVTAPKKIMSTEEPTKVTQPDFAKALIEGVTDVPQYVMNKMKDIIRNIPKQTFKLPGNKKTADSDATLGQPESQSLIYETETKDGQNDDLQENEWTIKDKSRNTFEHLQAKEPTVGERQQKSDLDLSLYTTSTTSPTAPWVFPEFEGTTLNVYHGRQRENSDDDLSESLGDMKKLIPKHRFKIPEKTKKTEESILGDRQQKSDLDLSLYTTSTTSPTAPWVFPEFEGTTLNVNHGRQSEDSDPTIGHKLDWVPNYERKDSFNSFGKIVPAKGSSELVPNNSNNLLIPKKAFFYGNMELPLRMKYYPDGTIKLAVDKKKYCKCSECSAENDVHSKNPDKRMNEGQSVEGKNKSTESFEDTVVGMSAPNELNRYEEMDIEETHHVAEEPVPTNSVQLEITTRMYTENKNTNPAFSAELLENSQSEDERNEKTTIETRIQQRARHWDPDSLPHNIEPINDTVESRDNLQSKRESNYIKKMKERKNRLLAKMDRKKSVFKRSPLLKMFGTQEEICAGNDCKVDSETTQMKRHLDNKIVQHRDGFMTDRLS